MDRVSEVCRGKHSCEANRKSLRGLKLFFGSEKGRSNMLCVVCFLLLSLLLLSGMLSVGEMEDLSKPQKDAVQASLGSQEDGALKEDLATSAELIEEEQYDDAVEVLNAMLEREPSEQMRAVVFYNLGLCYYYLSDFPGAIKAFQSSVDTKPFADAYYNLGRAYEESGQYGCAEEAIKAYSGAIAMEPEDKEYLLVRASAYESIGQSEDALEDYHAVLELDEGNTYASEGLQRLKAGR